MRNRIFPLMRKETLHILRDPRSLYLAIILPILLLVLFGYAVTFDVKHIPLGIVDQDKSSLSRDLISQVRGSEYFDVLYFLDSLNGVEKLLDKGDVKLILAIPPHFSRDVYGEKETPLQLLIDGSDNNTAQIALGHISGMIQIFSSRIILGRFNNQGAVPITKIPPINLEPRIWYNPGLRSANFIVPGLIAVVMMVLAGMSTSLTIAREWETGTMEQLISTPVKTYEIVVGKITPYFFLGIIQISLVIFAGRFVFDVPLKGNILFLFFISGIFLVCGLGIGLFISTITKSQQLAFMLSMLITLLPSFILSGFIFPVSSMPRLIQYFTYLVPAKYFLIVLRGIFLKGNGFAALWPEVLYLFIFASLILLVCARRLRLSLE